MWKCGISSLHVFFFVAAITGCISVIMNMSYTDAPSDTGGTSASKAVKFGSTYVVEPKGKHQATIVWLHGLGDDGLSWSQVLETLPLPNIKWICPTSPVQPLTIFGGISTTAWFDVVGVSEDASPDVQGMDESAAYVFRLLSTEPPNIKLGVGGFSMGAAAAIYSASCFACRKFGNRTSCPPRLDAVVALSGWLPCARALSDEVEVRASLPILLCHGKGDEVVQFQYGEKSAKKLTSAGFENLTFKPFNSLGHYITPEEMAEVASWLTSKLELEGFDVVGVSEDASPDVQGMDASAAYVFRLLSTEPPNIKLGVGGFSMGAAAAIYSASCFVCRKFGNRTSCPPRLDAVVALSGWLPCARALSDEVEVRASLPILLCHGKGDEVVRFHYGEKSAKKLISVGFENLTFKPFNSLGHYITPEEMAEVVSWLTSKLELEGKS